MNRYKDASSGLVLVEGWLRFLRDSRLLPDEVPGLDERRAALIFAQSKLSKKQEDHSGGSSRAGGVVSKTSAEDGSKVLKAEEAESGLTQFDLAEALCRLAELACPPEALDVDELRTELDSLEEGHDDATATQPGGVSGSHQEHPLRRYWKWIMLRGGDNDDPCDRDGQHPRGEGVRNRLLTGGGLGGQSMNGTVGQTSGGGRTLGRRPSGGGAMTIRRLGSSSSSSVGGGAHRRTLTSSGGGVRRGGRSLSRSGSSVVARSAGSATAAGVMSSSHSNLQQISAPAKKGERLLHIKLDALMDMLQG